MENLYVEKIVKKEDMILKILTISKKILEYAIVVKKNIAYYNIKKSLNSRHINLKFTINLFISYSG